MARNYQAEIVELLRKNNALLSRLLEITEQDMDLDPSEPRCPACGSTETRDVSTMGDPPGGRQVFACHGSEVTNAR